MAAAMIEKSRESSVAASLAGVLTLLLGASGVLVELRYALNTMWEIPVPGGNGLRKILKDRTFSIGML